MAETESWKGTEVIKQTLCKDGALVSTIWVHPLMECEELDEGFYETMLFYWGDGENPYERCDHEELALIFHESFVETHGGASENQL